MRRDAELTGHIRRVFEENFEVFGGRKIWREQRREGRDVARCTVERAPGRKARIGVLDGTVRSLTFGKYF